MGSHTSGKAPLEKTLVIELAGRFEDEAESDACVPCRKAGWDVDT